MYRVVIIYLDRNGNEQEVTGREEAYLARIPVAGDSITGLGSVDKVVNVRLIALDCDTLSAPQLSAYIYCQGTDDY